MQTDPLLEDDDENHGGDEGENLEDGSRIPDHSCVAWFTTG